MSVHCTQALIDFSWQFSIFVASAGGDDDAVPFEVAAESVAEEPCSKSASQMEAVFTNIFSPNDRLRATTDSAHDQRLMAKTWIGVYGYTAFSSWMIIIFLLTRAHKTSSTSLHLHHRRYRSDVRNGNSTQSTNQGHDPTINTMYRCRTRPILWAACWSSSDIRWWRSRDIYDLYNSRILRGIRWARILRDRICRGRARG
jgi:hypothetical protein